MGFPAKQAREGISLLRCEAFIDRADTQSLLHWNICGVNFASYWKRDSCLWWRVSVVQTQEWWWRSQVLLLFVVFHFLSGEPSKHLILSSDKWDRTKKNKKQNWPFHFTFETYEEGQSRAPPQCLEMLFLKQKYQRRKNKWQNSKNVFFKCCNVDPSRNDHSWCDIFN